MNATFTDTVSILVVDDHPENVLALQAMLSRSDYEVVSAASGAEALKRVLKQEFAVILLDVLMPAMDGFETARLIRQRDASRSVPILFLTANGAEADLVYRGYSVGAVDYMIKPLDPDIVRAKVAVFADLFRKTQQIRAQAEQLRAAERKNSERALRESEALYETTFDEAAVGIGHVASDGRWLRVNRKLCDIFGYSERDLLRVRLQDLTHPDDSGPTVAGLRQILAGESEGYRRELRCLDRRGNAVWVNLGLSTLRGSSSSSGSGQFIAVVEDMTDRKLAADRQRVLSAVSESLLRSLDYRETLADVLTCIVPVLADWCVIDIASGRDVPDGAAARHADPDRSELALKLARRAVDDPRSPLISVMQSGLSMLISGAGGAPPLLASDPESLALARQVGLESAIIVPLSGRGRTFGTIVLASASVQRRYGTPDLIAAEDLASRVALAIENARLYETAQHAISARDEFLSIASHELRTPLTPLQITFHRLLRERSRERVEHVGPERLRTMLVRGERQVSRLTTLIDSLLDVSRISSGRMRLNLEELDLAEVSREVLARSADEVTRAGCSVELRAQPNVRGSWDRMRIEQVLTNLLGNAIKYGASKPIEVSVSSDRQHAQLSVRDHGIGIDPRAIDRIFDRFERAVSSRSYGGLGLGLYITRQIVEAHGGTIRVSSELGAGSQFVVEIPFEPGQSAEREPNDESGEAKQHGTAACAE